MFRDFDYYLRVCVVGGWFCLGIVRIHFDLVVGLL